MKLSNKILAYYIAAIIFVITISSLLTTITFRRSLNDYLEIQTQNQFNIIAEDISSLFNSGMGVIDSVIFDNYAKGKEVNIKVYDNTDSLISHFEGINQDYLPDHRLVTKEFSLYNQQDVAIGKIEISYFENLYLYNRSLENFYLSIVRTYGLIILTTILIGIILSSYFSKRIVKPINKMNIFTKELKEGKYLTIDSNTDTFELDELARNLNYLSHTLSLQDKYRANYAQDISHELRTPLTNLLLHLEGIKDNIITMDSNILAVLVSEVKRLSSMVENLETSFKEAEGELNISISKEDISQIIDQVVLSFSPQFKDKSISVLNKYSDQIFLNIDKDKFIQVMNNIISNSIKAIDGPGNIEINTKEYKNRTVIIVKDDGYGIDKESLNRLFERFYRADTARNKMTGGHGLGLTITKSYVELMGGNININSKEGKGTEVILTFI